MRRIQRQPAESLLTSVFLPTPPPETVRTATPFPMVSLFLVFTAFVISNIGHIRPQRTILAFVSGIFFILSGKPKERTDRLQDHFRYQEPGAPLPIRPPLPCWVTLKELQNLSKPHLLLCGMEHFSASASWVLTGCQALF